MTDTWLPEISDDDIAVLVEALEALEAWETKDFAGEMMSDLFGAMLVKKDPDAKAQIDQDQRSDKLKRARATALRKERSVILRAKLLTIRERRRVDVVVRDVGATVGAVDPHGPVPKADA
jgi:hypothetical protein